MKGIVAKIWGKPAPPFLLFICGFCLTSETGYVIVCLLMMYCDDRVSVIFSQSAGLCGMARLGIIYYPPPHYVFHICLCLVLALYCSNC